MKKKQENIPVGDKLLPTGILKLYRCNKKILKNATA
nr:MAG TPA: hypothetical protein [Caudoviricetes sp.]